MCLTAHVFSVKNRLIKHIDGCPMGGHISVVFSDVYISKMEEDIVALMKPHFYKRYVDDMHIRRKKNQPDSLFEELNSYHPNIKLRLPFSESNKKITKNLIKKLVIFTNNKCQIQHCLEQ